MESFFFFNDPATTGIYTLSLHDALPISPPKPAAPNPEQAVPDKAPPSATDFSAGPKQVDQQMADAEVTEEQLAKSNEPEFTGALKEKKAGEAHAATAPGEVRADRKSTRLNS